MWAELEEPWKRCFQQAWESYQRGSVPIGAVIVDEKQMIIADGRNRVNEKTDSHRYVSWHKLAHAELNALLQISHHEHPNIRLYTIYSTLEPCPLCFGAIVMSNVRNIIYAARDRYAGSTNVAQYNNYIKSKPIKIGKVDEKLEIVSIALNTDYALRNWRFAEQAISEWSKDCPLGTRIGRRLFTEGRLVRALKQQTDISDIVDEIEMLFIKN